MPTSIFDLKRSENKNNIQQEIINILKWNKSNGFTLNEVEMELRKKKALGITIGGNFYLYFLLQSLISEGIIISIISEGREYFFIE